MCCICPREWREEARLVKVRLITLERRREFIGALLASPVDGKGAGAPTWSRGKPRGREGQVAAPARHGEGRDPIGESRVSSCRVWDRVRRTD